MTSEDISCGQETEASLECYRMNLRKLRRVFCSAELGLINNIDPQSGLSRAQSWPPPSQSQYSVSVIEVFDTLCKSGCSTSSRYDILFITVCYLCFNHYLIVVILYKTAKQFVFDHSSYRWTI